MRYCCAAAIVRLRRKRCAVWGVCGLGRKAWPLDDGKARDMTSTAPIGVFDSGLGGISVARQIVQDMPHEQVLYFGDSANAPYGTKTPQQVRG